MKQNKSVEKYRSRKDKIINTDLMIEASQEALSALRKIGYRIPRDNLPYTTFYHVKLPRNKNIEQALQDFEELGVNDSVEFNTEIMLDIVVPKQDWPGYATQITLQGCMDIDRLWGWLADYENKNTLHPVIVGIMDKGIPKLDHENLKNAFLLPAFDAYNNFLVYSNDSVKYPNDGHSTYCSSVIATTPNSKVGFSGLCPNAKILPMKITNGAVDVVIAIAHAMERGARVLSMSVSMLSNLPASQILSAARGRNIIVCMSSGNVANGSPSGIAQDKSVLSISGITPCEMVEGGMENYPLDPLFRYQFCTAAFYNSGVNFFAPFHCPVIGMESYQMDWFILSGTSFSTPAVASLFALLFSIDPSLTWGDAVTLVARHCLPVRPNTYYPDQTFPHGYGVPQFVKTLWDLTGYQSKFAKDGKDIRQLVARDAEGNKRYCKKMYYMDYEPGRIPEKILRHVWG